MELDQPCVVLITGIAYIYIQLNGEIKAILDYKAHAFQEDRSRGRVRPSLGDPQNAPRRGRGGRVSYVIRRTRRGEAPWRGRRVESACSTGTSRRQLRFNTPLQSQLVDPTQRLERKSSKSVVGRPFVKMSANCLALGI